MFAVVLATLPAVALAAYPATFPFHPHDPNLMLDLRQPTFSGGDDDGGYVSQAIHCDLNSFEYPGASLNLGCTSWGYYMFAYNLIPSTGYLGDNYGIVGNCTSQDAPFFNRDQLVGYTNLGSDEMCSANECCSFLGDSVTSVRMWGNFVSAFSSIVNNMISTGGCDVYDEHFFCMLMISASANSCNENFLSSTERIQVLPCMDFFLNFF